MLLNANQEENQVYIYGKFLGGLRRQFVQTTASQCSVNSYQLSLPTTNQTNRPTDQLDQQTNSACFSAVPSLPLCSPPSAESPLLTGDSYTSPLLRGDLGVCYIYAVAQDTSDNTSLPSEQIRYILESATQPPAIDTTPPQITNISDVPDPFSPCAGIRADTEVCPYSATITFTIIDQNPDIWKLWFYNSDNLNIRTIMGLCQAPFDLFASSPFNLFTCTVSAYWDGKDDSGALVPDGTYTYIVSAMDLYNNYTEATAAITIDTTPPTLTILSPLNRSALVLGATQTIRMQAGDSSPPIVTAYIDETLIGTATQSCRDAQLCVSTSTLYTFTFILDNFSQGRHILKVVATDLALNSASSTIELIFASSQIYLPQFFSNSTLIINVLTNEITGSLAVGNNPIKTLSTADTLFTYTANTGSDDVTEIDSVLNAITKTIPTQDSPVSLAISTHQLTNSSTHQLLYVVNKFSDSVSVIDIAGGGNVIATIPVGVSPSDIVISPDGTIAYTTNQGSNNISILDLAQNIVAGTIELQEQTQGQTQIGQTQRSVPTGLDISPDGSILYVLDFSNNQIIVIDTATKNIISTIPTGMAPIDIQLSTITGGLTDQSDQQTAFVTNRGSNNISLIDLTTGETLQQIPVSYEPLFMFPSPTKEFIYVTHTNTDEISIVNLQGGQN